MQTDNQQQPAVGSEKEPEHTHFTCSWCGETVAKKPIIGGDLREKKFCSWDCQRNDYEHFHDNWHSDSDSGL